MSLRSPAYPSSTLQSMVSQQRHTTCTPASAYGIISAECIWHDNDSECQRAIVARSQGVLAASACLDVNARAAAEGARMAVLVIVLAAVAAGACLIKGRPTAHGNRDALLAWGTMKGTTTKPECRQHESSSGNRVSARAFVIYAYVGCRE